MPQKHESPDLVPIIQMVLRLIGIYFFVVGAASLAEDITRSVIEWKRYGFSVGGLLSHIGFPRFWGSLVYFLAGLYLLVGGRWLIVNVFLPSSNSPADDKVDEPEGDDITTA